MRRRERPCEGAREASSKSVTHHRGGAGRGGAGKGRRDLRRGKDDGGRGYCLGEDDDDDDDDEKESETRQRL